MTKHVILTGLRANNDLHIGNYFGALMPIIDMANKRAENYQINLFVPDLHSITTPIDYKNLYAQTMHNLKIYSAAGLDLKNQGLFLYRQSYIPAHAELTWILDCFCGLGNLNRMTQFKEKAKAQDFDSTLSELNEIVKLNDVNIDKIRVLTDTLYRANLQEASASAGLYTYPVLMAADILLYGAIYVPVGDDQSQHLEFTRDIAERMNKQFADIFPEGIFTVPMPVSKQHEFFGKDQGLRIRDLQNPTKKMSKSNESSRGIIFLGDKPEEAARKIMAAETDSLASIPYSLDYESQPGLSNLLQMLALLDNKPIGDVLKQWSGKNIYGDLKTVLADKIYRFLTDFQAHFSEVDELALQAKLESSEATMREVANATLNRVQRAVGLRKKGRTDKVRSGGISKPAVLSFNDYAKLDLRIGTVQNAELLDGSDKLLKLTVDLGSSQRTIVTGMRQYYDPEIFIGKQLPIITNLRPKSYHGTTSQGMLLAIEGNKGPVLLLPAGEVPNGSPIE
jgi:tryptophanyl-tRNA synthetase